MHYSTQQTGIVRRSLHVQHASLLFLHLSTARRPSKVAFSMRGCSIIIGCLPSGPSLRPPAFQKHLRLCVSDAVRSDPCGESTSCNMHDGGVPVRSFSLISTRGPRRRVTIAWNDYNSATARARFFSSALLFIPVEQVCQPVGQVCLKIPATGKDDIPTSPFVRCGNISCRLTATAIRSTKSVPPTRSGYI